MNDRPGGSDQVGQTRWDRPGGTDQVGQTGWDRPGGTDKVRLRQIRRDKPGVKIPVDKKGKPSTFSSTFSLTLYR